MNFSYVNLPKLPIEFEQLCLDLIPLSKTNPWLIEANKKEGVSHSITFLPTEVKLWIIKNILPIIDPSNKHPELTKKMMLHINEYIEHEEGNGVHPIHIDYGRKYTFNYILTLGGSNPVTTWYLNDKSTVIEEHSIEARRWCLLYVNPAWHGVRGQEPEKLRTIISLCFDPIELSTFDAKEHFKHILCDS
jgi:hypothetical protein